MKKMLSFLLVILLVFTGCAAANVNETSESTEKKVGMEIQYAGWTMEQYLENSECAFLGICRSASLEEDKLGIILEFDSITALMGKYDNSIHEFRGLASTDYKIGSEYLIFCSKESSVYTDHDYYGFSIAVTADENGIHHEGIRNFQYDSMDAACDSIKAYINAHPKDQNEKETYCKSDDLEEIYTASDYVFIIEVTGIFDNSVPDRTSYNFEMIEEIKGNFSGEQWIISFKDSMTEGKKYLVMMEKPGEDAAFFTMSSKNSVFSSESKEAALILELK